MSAVATVAAAGTIKVVSSVAVKAAVTAGTALVVGPALKAATLGASVVQIGVQKFREDKKNMLTSKVNATLIELSATAEIARENEERLQKRRKQVEGYADTTSRAVAQLPQGATTMPRTLKFVVAFGVLGTFAPTRWAPKVLLAAAAAAMASRLIRRLDGVARKAAQDTADELYAASIDQAAAATAAAKVDATLRRLQDANVYADMSEFDKLLVGW